MKRLPYPVQVILTVVLALPVLFLACLAFAWTWGKVATNIPEPFATLVYAALIVGIAWIVRMSSQKA